MEGALGRMSAIVCQDIQVKDVKLVIPAPQLKIIPLSFYQKGVQNSREILISRNIAELEACILDSTFDFLIKSVVLLAFSFRREKTVIW